MASSSSSSPLLVIASGDTIVTWDCRAEPPSDSQQDSSSTVVKTFYPFSTNATSTASTTTSPAATTPKIADVAWNHNAQVLACCSTGTSLDEQLRKNIVLSSSHSGSLLDSFRHTDSTSDLNNNKNATITNKRPESSGAGTGPAATCVTFGGKSRYLCIGDERGDVCLWDLKKQSRVRQFKSKKGTPCLQACLDPSATYVCSLSAEKFTLYNLRQATFAKQWTFSTSQKDSPKSILGGGWKQFRFSPLQPNILAMGDSTGRIQIYDGLDYGQPQLVCGGGFTNHPSMASSLLSHHASPVSGLAFSTQNSKLLANIRANGILEFVDTSTGEVIHHQQTGGSASALAFQGVSCVVGTETGEVQVYDLRKMMQQFGKAVTTYQTPSREAVRTLDFAPIPKSSGSHNGRTRTRSSSPPSRRPSGSGSSFGLNAVSFDLESRASNTSYQEPLLQTAPSNSSLQPPATAISFRKVSEDRKPEAVDNPKAEIPGSDKRNTTSDVPPSVAASSDPGNQSSVASHTQYTIQKGTIEHTQPPRQEAKILATELDVSSNSIHRSSDQNIKKKAQNDVVSPNPKPDNALRNEKVNEAGYPSGTSDSSPEIGMFLQNVVRQEVQHHVFSLREDLEGSIRNLHVDMIRQFQRQSQEITHIVQQQQDRIEQLMRENDFLREQNAVLMEQHQKRHHPGYNGGMNGFK